MTQQFFVGSKSQSSVIPVEGNGVDQREARRSAIQFARARHQISDPVVLSEHEAARRMRQQFLAQFAPKTPANMNGNGKPFWLRNPGSRYYN